mgnify:CR=1 FL=1
MTSHLLLLLLPAAHKSSLPPLNQQHELKLKQLTVASLALQQKVGAWLRWCGVWVFHRTSGSVHLDCDDGVGYMSLRVYRFASRYGGLQAPWLHAEWTQVPQWCEDAPCRVLLVWAGWDPAVIPAPLNAVSQTSMDVCAWLTCCCCCCCCCQVLPYDMLQTQLSIGTVRDLEDFLITDCFYTGKVAAVFGVRRGTT